MNRTWFTPGRSFEERLAKDTMTTSASNQFQPELMNRDIHEPNMLKASSSANATANISSKPLNRRLVVVLATGWISASANDETNEATIMTAKKVCDRVES